MFLQGSLGSGGQKGVAGVDGEEVDSSDCIDYRFQCAAICFFRLLNKPNVFCTMTCGESW